MHTRVTNRLVLLLAVLSLLALVPTRSQASPHVDPLYHKNMVNWMAAYQRNGFGFHWPYQGDASILRVDLPSNTIGGAPMNVTRAAYWTRRIHDSFTQARGNTGMWRNASACTVIAYLHGVEVASNPDRPHPGQLSLNDAALRAVADYVARNGEAKRDDVLLGFWFKPALPEDNGTYNFDKMVRLVPYDAKHRLVPYDVKNSAVYTVYFSQGRSGLYEVVKIRRDPSNSNQHSEYLPLTSR